MTPGTGSKTTRLWPRSISVLGAAFLSTHQPASGLVWQTNTTHRVAAVQPPAGNQVGFTLLDPSQTGVQFTNQLADFSAAQNRILESGSGVALGDIDGDGWCDIYFCRLEGDNRLYRNLGGWKFEDITDRAGVACPNQYSTGAVLADVDGDGDLDLLVNSVGGGTRCFFNDGRGTFTELTESRLARRYTGMSMALADADGDGDLDLYVANYGTTSYRDDPPGLKVEARRVGGKIVVTPEDRFIAFNPMGTMVELMELGERDFFYINDGTGRFLPVSWTGGSFLDIEDQPYKAPPRGWGLSVLFRDLNEDGFPDLYVCNDFFYFPDDIWLNAGGKRFRTAKAREVGHCSLSSMAVDAADINRDGHWDFFVADMVSRDHNQRHRQRPDLMGGRVKVPVNDPTYRPEVPRNTLFLNRGDSTWVDIAPLSGLEATEWTWGAVFLDVDLDGWEDLLIANGNNHDVQDADTLQALSQLKESPSPQNRLKNLQRFGRLSAPNLAFRNRHDLTFENRSEAWGFQLTGISHGMALADLDNDGDLDVVLNNLHQNASLYRNDSSRPRIAVRLRGKGANSHGIGAKITLIGGPVEQTQEMISGGRYLSCDEAIRMFAAEAAVPGHPLTLKIDWRTGGQSIIEGVQPNSIYEIDERTAIPPSAPATKPEAPKVSFQSIRFADVSQLLHHQHLEEPFNDFDRQPLLSHSLSGRGPGLAWIDLDRDGHEDLVIGGGKGGNVAILKNLPGSGFTLSSNHVSTPLARGTAGMIASFDSNGRPGLILALSHYEDSLATNATLHGLDWQGTVQREWASTSSSSPGPLATADIDGDGDLDVFLGGRVKPGRYPEPASSSLWRNDGLSWQEDRQISRSFDQVGMVSGAVFTDLNQDGTPELVLACEWGPLRVFHHEDSGWKEMTSSLGLQHQTGWWNGVTSGDFDGDGRLDLIASNWGHNTRFQSFLSHPIEVYFADFQERGIVSLLECYFDPQMGGMVPWRDWELVTRELPWVKEVHHSHRRFGQATIQEILGAHAAQVQRLRVTTLSSSVFLNRGGRFEERSLPIEAQFSPAFGIAVADFNADGKEDVFLAQNFFGVTLETARYDGGRGLLLQGQGNGSFLVAASTGIEILGEQRGAAVADFDEDGRVDLAVTQNRGATRLFRNTATTRGLRVKLRGPAKNPLGVGAILRAGNANGLGPAREIHGGSGYWSQDSAVTLMSAPGGEPPTTLKILWPGGKTTETSIPNLAVEVEVDTAGRLLSSKR